MEDIPLPPPDDFDPPPPPPSSRENQRAGIPPPPPSSHGLPLPDIDFSSLPPLPKQPEYKENGAISAKKQKLGWAAKSKRPPPIDLEELVAKKKAADADAKKLRFIPKAERERIALEQREKEAVAIKARTEEALRAREEWLNESKPQRQTRDVPTGPAAMRNGHDNRHSSHHRRNGNAEEAETEKKRLQTETAVAQIRERYMGPQTNESKFSAKKKRKRTTEKKFNFEWNADEDTTVDDDLYANRTDSLMFGRGKLAGFGDEDRDQAILKMAREIVERDKETGLARAHQLLEMERQRKEQIDKTGLTKHWSDKDLDQMRERDWRIFKEDFKITTKGGNLPNPMRSWSESGLPARILDIVQQVGYDEPSAIQRAAIPIALQNRDIIGVAVTGSGKTASFLLPLLVYISELPQLNEITKNDGPYAIILAPTRELAQQIEVEAKKFATPLGFTCVSLVGGRQIEEQAYNMRDGAEIIVATPGRLIDCLERRLLVLGQCCYVIMDEADKMIDMGLEDAVNKVLDALPVTNEKPNTDEAENGYQMSKLVGRDRYRQTMMYTATMIPAVERIARTYLRRPAIINIGNTGEAVETVEQRVEFISGEDKKKKRLGELLAQFPAPIIVFVNMKRNCDAIANSISRMGYNAVTLHGSKTQDQRESALQSLRDGKTAVLVATDLAGRGIDVADVSLVVNFNMAPKIESYTHRIGRTGRAGKTGVAITFLGSEDNDVLYDLKQIISKSSVSRMSDELRRHPAAQQKVTRTAKKPIEEAGGSGSRFGRS